ncbi:tRNA modification GTPase [Desulfohalotomaculum tongense]|uniref:tRNA uridine-5-carboxymethylaminomethyl(34) synthesis GTPase MnmE n=1 Tax=Desulforadius tongensis TaxID=1216062 RepID=UPI001958D9C2|nr:tRNA uridine-5-carboxymethylaminomethyl(34) synthesis GTPase MnmE [Desulforadius tongensis]MBM7855824.1 tRNA modification GTPase [Desulforadius tongensis]
MIEDTIAAIATPLGEGGIGIVRISGPEAIEVGQKIFKAKYNKEWYNGPGFRLIYGHVHDKETGEIVDEALLSIMRKPKSFTGEDVVEINCHGGMLPLKKTLELAVKNGARLAGPGEFSKRAFLNGKLDLAQAESIIDIIRSKTDTGLKISMGQLQGRLSAKVNEMQSELLGMLAQIEANIDFPEDDIEEASLKQICRRSEAMLQEVNKLIAGAENGRIYREGVRTVIIGRPNVGKSSLLNALLKENRAIVTDIPGTTRDIIEEFINIGGIPLKIVDTAGLRETEDVVEKIGVERSKELISRADLILFVLDAAEGVTADDYKIIKLLPKNNNIIVIVNKIDVENSKINARELKDKFNDTAVIEISALQGRGLEQLEQEIVKLVMGGQVSVDDQILITNMRHKQSLEKAKLHLVEVKNGIEAGVPGDLVSIDIKNAWEALGEITGSTVSEDLIDKIFEDFCIGK